MRALEILEIPIKRKEKEWQVMKSDGKADNFTGIFLDKNKELNK